MRGLLLASVTLAALAGASHAQYAPPPPGLPYGPFPRVHPGQTELQPGYPPVDNAPSPHPLQDHREKGRPLGCWASFNGYSCGSLRSDWVFIFGSCRDFYGEPCLKGPPPSPLPPWAIGDGGRMPPRPDAKAVKKEGRAENAGPLRRLLFFPPKLGCTSCAQP